ncbi:MAG: OmpH family outer membrane protein [Bacteroidetes bacterium]|nr:OmpH family outer membrane protein [Bacteroidota bacterium]
MLAKISIAISFVALILVSCFLLGTQNKTVAFANTEKLVYSFKGMQAAHDAYNLKQQQIKGELEKLNMEYQSLIQHFKENQKSLSEKQEREEIQAIGSKEMELKNLDEKTKSELREMDEKSTQGVLNQVDALVKKYAEDEGYDLVLGGNDGNILYGSEVLDITEDLIKHINENYEDR